MPQTTVLFRLLLQIVEEKFLWDFIVDTVSQSVILSTHFDVTRSRSAREEACFLLLFSFRTLQMAKGGCGQLHCTTEVYLRQKTQQITGIWWL